MLLTRLNLTFPVLVLLCPPGSSCIDSLSSIRVAALDRGNGLSSELLQGCRVVLMGRDVVRSLMTQCENITNKMMQDVSQVMERDTGSQKQPEILNSKWVELPFDICL
ncbi:hypothetical protein DPEC_G00094880 [Dallia pectoralis]|uniref:Uncharacterized protein n=1 Tax=Dallia pectoralis TaxID=75939 RepID=A0ACC2H1C4_DALPE|nr:hypothetical protein DPEC_G00094880 [Dallia pectoralis]